MLVRLQKFLAEANIASRRKCEEIIEAGRVTVNGEVAVLGAKIDDELDEVRLDGELVKKDERLVYIMLNKPEGCVTTAHDQFERSTVMDCIDDIEERIYPVGRLDYDTSGLLLMTNDGDLTYRLTHPKHNINKTYIAVVDSEPTAEEIRDFETGLIIDGRKTARARLIVAKRERDRVYLKITIHEGRNRQVRKMCDAIGHPVRRLMRVATGKLSLGTLKKGEYRHLTADEVEYLKSL
jgi:pseudouridine synthase